MALSGTPPFTPNSWNPPRPVPPQPNTLPAVPSLSSGFNPQPPSLSLPLSPTAPAQGMSPVGPIVNGLVPVVRNPGVNGASPASSLPGGSPWNSPVDTFSPAGSMSPMSRPTTPGSPVSGMPNGVASAWSTDGAPLNAQDMGKKVGGIVSNFLEENPVVLEKLNNIDLDEIEQNVGPKVEGWRAQLQQALKKLPESVDKRLIRMLDPGTQEIATEVDQWLRKEPDEATLAELAAKKRAKAREEALGGKTGKPHAAYPADDLLDDEEFFADDLPPKKQTYREKVSNALSDGKDKLVDKAQSSWPLNRNKTDLSALEDEEPVIRPRRKPLPLDDELTDADIEALLGGGPAFKAKGAQK